MNGWLNDSIRFAFSERFSTVEISRTDFAPFFGEAFLGVAYVTIHFPYVINILLSDGRKLDNSFGTKCIFQIIPDSCPIQRRLTPWNLATRHLVVPSPAPSLDVYYSHWLDRTYRGAN
jgi:hypothetical protein